MKKIYLLLIFLLMLADLNLHKSTQTIKQNIDTQLRQEELAEMMIMVKYFIQSSDKLYQIYY